ncbi:MAG TPA: hypothetical protein VLS88_04275 [Polyangiales bacterium]|nr:hypothetical protein [Polyangiales bacterium]
MPPLLPVRRVRTAALLLALLAAACTESSMVSTGNTELNLDIVNPGGTSGELGFSVDRVDYRITCAGTAPGSQPIPPADTNGADYQYDDSVDISGAFEVVDTRVPPVWQAVMDLPPGACTVTLSVWEDDEIVCVGSQTLAIAEDATTKYDIVLVCSLSIDTPDGMADVDGTFEFITGNVCPKVYVLNALEFAPFTAPGFESGAEIQYRAKDPDNSCGNNCDPQSCTTDNPPVCTPYPSNIQDPNCNSAAGGDPNSAACLAGDHAGLVCTIAAFPLALPLGALGGTFISPADGTTPVGPVLSVNLNTASGVPGVILPGLGGPAGTGAEDSPAYPGLPNVNGSLPPLIYQCAPTLPGPVIISLVCSDGDLECNQQKEVRITCGVPDWCIGDPVDCSSSGECLTDGVCDFTCDPNTSCDRCVGQDDPQPAGRPCAEGGGNVCDGAGSCVECLDGENTGFPQSNPSCDSTPVDCLLPSQCAGNTCQARTVAPNGTTCSNGICSGGICVFDPVDPCQDTPFSTCEGYIGVVCGNNITSDVSLLGYWLISDPEPIIANQPFDVFLAGVATFDESFLDAAQGAIAGGVTKALVVDVKATVQTRGGGATGPNVTLEGSLPSHECLLDDTGPGVQQFCNPVNDLASIPGLRGNTDCVPTGGFNPCGRIVELPISSDCAPGGVCDTLGKASQCAANGFCVDSPLFLQLTSTYATFTAGDGVSPGQTTALFGWYDTPADATQFVGTPPIDPDGTYNVQQPVYTGVSGPIGFAVNAAGLAIQLDCVQGVYYGDLADGFPQDASPTPDALLRAFPVQVP